MAVPCRSGRESWIIGPRSGAARLGISHRRFKRRIAVISINPPTQAASVRNGTLEAKMDWAYVLGDVKFYALEVVELTAYVLVIAAVVTIGERLLAKFGIGHK